MCDDKRKRSPNWLPSEKTLLIDLVESNFDVVENKKTDGVSMKRKLAQWKIIAEQYNSRTTHCSRSAENLKSQWESLKKAAKKEESNVRMQRIQTGGGPPQFKKEDPVHSRIICLIKTSAVGLHNPFDSDSVVPGVLDNDEVAVETGNFSEPQPSCSKDNKIIDMEQPVQFTETKEYDVIVKDWGDYTPQLLRTPLSTSLRLNVDEDGECMGRNVPKNRPWVSRRRPAHSVTTSSLENLHKKKIEAIELQKSLARKQVDQADEVNNVDLQIKSEILKQEKLKTRILLLELRLKKRQLQKMINDK